MNIFVLDENPVKAAKAQLDKHVVKMPLETAQLLCSPFEKGAPYKRTHFNHPCSIWARTSEANFTWLYLHGKALCAEYSYRYGKEHKSLKAIEWAFAHRHLVDFTFTHKKLTPFAVAMPDDVKEESVVESYRNYYKKYKVGFAYWTKRKPPQWWARFERENLLSPRWLT